MWYFGTATEPLIKKTKQPYSHNGIPITSDTTGFETHYF